MIKCHMFLNNPLSYTAYFTLKTASRTALSLPGCCKRTRPGAKLRYLLIVGGWGLRLASRWLHGHTRLLSRCLGDHHGVRGLGLLATAVVAAAATEDDDDHQADNATDDNGDDDPNAESHSGLHYSKRQTREWIQRTVKAIFPRRILFA